MIKTLMFKFSIWKYMQKNIEKNIYTVDMIRRYEIIINFMEVI